MSGRSAALGAALLLAGCAAAPKPAPAPPVVAAAPPTVVVPPAETDWRDVPLTPGTWRYAAGEGGASSASYGPAGAALLVMACDGGTHAVTVTWLGPNGGALTIRTSSSSRTILPRAAEPGRVLASFAARDPFLDELAFSRGRFSVASPGQPTRYIPAWAEPARVIEDCRG